MYVFVPLHVGFALIAGALGVSVLPQLSFTIGKVGATAKAAHSTVEPPAAGNVKSES